MNRLARCQASTRAPTWFFARAIVVSLALAMLAVSGCAEVKVYQRDVLARPEMSPRADLGTRFVHHVFAVREAAEGGYGSVGGGCGCN